MKLKIANSQLIYSGYFNLKQDLLERADGLTHAYTSLTLSGDAVAVIAQTHDGFYILNREYRHPIGKALLGPPGGKLEEGEDPILGGQRELFEETGYWSDEIVVVGCSHPFPGLCDQKIHYLYAKNAMKRSGQKLDPFEFIETELKTDEELRKELQNGTSVDGNLCTALWYKDAFCRLPPHN